ncbi:MAG: hypothetical protein ABI337_05370 [Nitrososphaera sp.]|jgi:hypothetical protein
MRKSKKIALIIIIGVVGFFAAAGIAGYIWETYYPEDYAAFKAKQAEEQRQREILERQIELQKQAAQNKELKPVKLTEEQVIDLVKNYRGKDGKGDRLLHVLGTLIATAYPRQDILHNPSTVVDWYAFEDFSPKKQGIYIVHFVFETYREEVEYIWYVDTNNNNKIFAGNNRAQNILDILDNFD